LILTAFLCQAFAGEWALDTTSSATVVCGVGSSKDDKCAAAALANGVGSFVENWQDGKWKKTQIQTMMILDTAITPSGKIVAATVWPIFTSSDGSTYTKAVGVSGASQSANVFGSDKESFALVGSWVDTTTEGSKPVTVYGVASSTDSGNTWKISGNVPPGFARYGAFPTDTTWYVSSGMWGSSNLKNSDSGHYPMSERFEASINGGKFVENGKNRHLHSASNVSATGWFGAVSKSTDGGATWTQVFQTDYENDVIYFNGISCSSVDHCVVVGEGYDEQGEYKTVGHVTFDGGLTWTNSLTTKDVGLMQVDLISELEGWAAGTAKDGRNLYGQFYWTNDGGKTWVLKQSLNNCFCIDMDFADAKGFAACSSSSGSSCSVAIYQ